MLMVIVGFALVATRGGIPGSAAGRNARIAGLRIFSTPAYGETPTVRYRVIQILIGLLVLVGGFALIAVST